MRNTLLLSLFVLSSNLFADGHEQTQTMQNGYM